MTGRNFIQKIVELLIKEGIPPLEDEDVVMRINELTSDELIEIINNI
jgi:hypothetical protein